MKSKTTFIIIGITALIIFTAITCFFIFGDNNSDNGSTSTNTSSSTKKDNKKIENETTEETDKGKNISDSNSIKEENDDTRCN